MNLLSKFILYSDNFFKNKKVYSVILRLWGTFTVAGLSGSFIYPLFKSGFFLYLALCLLLVLVMKSGKLFYVLGFVFIFIVIGYLDDNLSYKKLDEHRFTGSVYLSAVSFDTRTTDYFKVTSNELVKLKSNPIYDECLGSKLVGKKI